jgi:hypothetical protein
VLAVEQWCGTIARKLGPVVPVEPVSWPKNGTRPRISAIPPSP